MAKKKITSYRKRPNCIVKCAVPGCKKLGFREDACPSCGEYRCPDHVDSPIQGGEVDEENITFLIDPKKSNEHQCFPCGNAPQRLSSIPYEEFEREYKEKSDEIRDAMNKTTVREQFSLLLLQRFKHIIQQLDLLESSPLEQILWAELFARSLDRYFQPQVELYDDNGNYIVRADFASNLLKIALFCDGRTYHSKPEDLRRDAEHNHRLSSLGWTVKRYWTEDINARRLEIVNEIYDLVCHRIAEMEDYEL